MDNKTRFVNLRVNASQTIVILNTVCQAAETMLDEAAPEHTEEAKVIRESIALVNLLSDAIQRKATEQVSRESLRTVFVQGKMCMYAQGKRLIDVPIWQHYYEIRHADDFEPATIERYVHVNYWGYLLSEEPLDFGGEDHICIDWKGLFYEATE